MAGATISQRLEYCAAKGAPRLRRLCQLVATALGEEETAEEMAQVDEVNDGADDEADDEADDDDGGCDAESSAGVEWAVGPRVLCFVLHKQAHLLFPGLTLLFVWVRVRLLPLLSLLSFAPLWHPPGVPLRSPYVPSFPLRVAILYCPSEFLFIALFYLTLTLIVRSLFLPPFRVLLMRMAGPQWSPP